ncbi:MAG: hypothetical protein MRY32_07810, partial [Rickettsiales bacterium]|nr:hypothetical protein [Rickettsiales bacterium]
MAKGPEHSTLNRKILPVGEWLAENAYIAPGKHRLMTATGLMLGLMAGREVMDVLVGRDRKGNIIDRSEALPPLRPFHGALAYNKYDDSPDQKWMHVADSFIPFVLGAAGAMVGSSQYMRFARHNPVMAGIIKESEKIAKGDIHTLQYADAVANQTHARNLNWMAGPNYGGGSVLGNHVVPSPLSQTVGAFRFQLGANKDAITPGMQKAFFGNYGASSKKPFTALKSLISWTENNMAHYGSSQWHKENGAITKQAKDALKIFKDRFGDQHVEVMEHYLEQRIGQLTREMERIKAEKGLDFGEELLKAMRKDPKFQAEINDAFWGEGLHKQYEKMGLFDPNNPEQVAELIGDNGMLSKIMKWMPGGADVSEAQ